MKTRHLLLALLFMGGPALRAQFGGFGDVPIEITAEGETHFSGGVAIAENNVVIHYGPTSIYADYVQYNPDTRDILAIGNVRIYRDGHLFVGDRALYNLETKLLRTADFRGDAFPFFFQAETVSSLENGAFEGTNALLTTSDSSHPDFSVHGKTVRIYPGKYVVMEDARLYIGNMPVFWVPAWYQSLNRDQGFSYTPGYDSLWGGYGLTRFGFPISDDINGMVHLDARTKRGYAVGLDATGTYGRISTDGENTQSWVRFRSYYGYDTNPETNDTATTRGPINPNRYRVSLQDRTYFTDDIYSTTDINKLSDDQVLHDFFPGEYKNNPQPDNVTTLTKWDENFTVTGLVRAQLNRFPNFGDTERLPEVDLDVKRTPVWTVPGIDLPLFYEGQTGIARLHRLFENSQDLSTSSSIDPGQTEYSDYRATRFDSFHQFTLPTTIDNWLSFIPRIGFRSTYYSQGANTYEALNSGQTTQEQDLQLTPVGSSVFQRGNGNSQFRQVFNTGFESSFKISQTWDSVQSRAWGLDGLLHVIQPYTDFSYVLSSRSPAQILQFDQLNASTQLPPIDFPQYNTIDSIPSWSIWRFGVRNRFETRRDDRTVTWLETNTFFDLNIDEPNFPGVPENSVSNLYNSVVWSPIPWLNVNLDTQLPILNGGFSASNGFIQVNTGVNFLVNDDLKFNVTHRYIQNNPFFENGSDLRVGAYYRIDDNWGISVTEEYEFQDHTLQTQDYQIHRDLSSFIASLGFVIRNNTSSTSTVTNYGVELSFTLKDMPSVTLPVNFDPSQTLLGGASGSGH